MTKGGQQAATARANARAYTKMRDSASKDLQAILTYGDKVGGVYAQEVVTANVGAGGKFNSNLDLDLGNGDLGGGRNVFDLDDIIEQVVIEREIVQQIEDKNAVRTKLKELKENDGEGEVIEVTERKVGKFGFENPLAGYDGPENI